MKVIRKEELERMKQELETEYSSLQAQRAEIEKKIIATQGAHIALCELEKQIVEIGG